MPNCNESRVEKGDFGQTESKKCISNFKSFFAQVGELPSKTVLVESEESNSDYRASGNRVT